MGEDEEWGRVKNDEEWRRVKKGGGCRYPVKGYFLGTKGGWIGVDRGIRGGGIFVSPVRK